MTLDRFDAEFPLVRDAAYLNHAASSPLPARSAAALRAHVEDRQRLAPLYQAGQQDYDTGPLKAKLARLLRAPVPSIGFVPTTTDGIAAVLNGIDWRPGDSVVYPANDFPGVLYACLALERRGVRCRAVPVDGHLDLDALIGAIDPSTRAVVVSHVHWQTGHRIDLVRLGRACRAAGTLSIVDAIQSAGAIPIDVTEAQLDVLVAGTYKWLLGIAGSAVIALSPRVIAEVLPDRLGWAGMRTSVHATPRIDPCPDASRYQVGGSPDAVHIALEGSVELLLEADPAAILRHVSALLDRLVAGLSEVGLRCLSDRRPDHRSTIVSISTGDRERDDRLARSLVERGIIVARRGPGIRVSPHLHNRPDQVDRLLQACAEILHPAAAAR